MNVRMRVVMKEMTVCMHLYIYVYMFVHTSVCILSPHRIAHSHATPRVHADNELGPKGAKALVPALQEMTGLQQLDLMCTLPAPHLE